MTDYRDKYKGENLTKIRADDVEEYDEAVWLVERLDEIIIRIEGEIEESRDWQRRATHSLKMAKKNRNAIQYCAGKLRGISPKAENNQLRRLLNNIADRGHLDFDDECWEIYDNLFGGKDD